MEEIKGNIWDYEDEGIIAVITNGIVKKDETAVMGAGIALELKNRNKNIPKVLGQLLKNKGNHIFQLTRNIITFPTKNHWRDKSDLKLIEQSAQELLKLADENSNDGYWQKIYVPQPGCGCGGLKWNEVRQILDKYFDDRFFIITNR